MREQCQNIRKVVWNLSKKSLWLAPKVSWNSTSLLCHLQTHPDVRAHTHTHTLTHTHLHTHTNDSSLCVRAGEREGLNLHQIPKSCHWLQTLWILHSGVLPPSDSAVCLYFSIGSFWYGPCSPDPVLCEVDQGSLNSSTTIQKQAMPSSNARPRPVILILVRQEVL